MIPHLIIFVDAEKLLSGSKHSYRYVRRMLGRIGPYSFQDSNTILSVAAKNRHLPLSRCVKWEGRKSGSTIHGRNSETKSELWWFQKELRARIESGTWIFGSRLIYGSLFLSSWNPTIDFGKTAGNAYLHDWMLRKGYRMMVCLVPFLSFFHGRNKKARNGWISQYHLNRALTSGWCFSRRPSLNALDVSRVDRAWTRWTSSECTDTQPSHWRRLLFRVHFRCKFIPDIIGLDWFLSRRRWNTVGI